MSGWSATIAGFIDATTTDAQLNAASTSYDGVFPASLNGAKVSDLRLYLQTSSGLFWMPNFSTETGASYYNTEAGCYLSNIRNSIDKAGLGQLSFTAIGYDSIALFEGTTTAAIAYVVESTG